MRENWQTHFYCGAIVCDVLFPDKNRTNIDAIHIVVCEKKGTEWKTIIVVAIAYTWLFSRLIPTAHTHTPSSFSAFLAVKTTHCYTVATHTQVCLFYFALYFAHCLPEDIIFAMLFEFFECNNSASNTIMYCRILWRSHIIIVIMEGNINMNY